MSLTIIPLSLARANRFVQFYHRHHKPVPGHKFAIGCLDADSDICGVAICGRPVARHLDDGYTLEVARTCTNGHFNANSILYGACRRIAKEMGYLRITTYTLPEEGGASLRAVGWEPIHDQGGGTWNRDGRPRDDEHPLGLKIRWECWLVDIEKI